jgi:hypothetical protein
MQATNAAIAVNCDKGRQARGRIRLCNAVVAPDSSVTITSGNAGAALTWGARANVDMCVRTAACCSAAFCALIGPTCCSLL